MVLKFGLRTATSPENLLEIQIIGPYSKLLNQEVWGAAQQSMA